MSAYVYVRRRLSVSRQTQVRIIEKKNTSFIMFKLKKGVTDTLCSIYPEKLVKKAKMSLQKFKKLIKEFDRQKNSALYIVNFHGFKLRFVDLTLCQSQES